MRFSFVSVFYLELSRINPAIPQPDVGDCYDIVVDDSPHVLERAQKLSITAAGLEFAWNRGNGFKLFRNLSEVLEHFKIFNLL